MPRPFNMHTPLGKRMAELGLRTYDVCGACKISPRMLSDYLAGRKKISPMNRAYLARYLQMDPDELQPH